VKFWDSSALIPLLIEETTTEQLRKILRADRDFAIWWGSRVECVSAISRLERMKDLESRQAIAVLGNSRLLLESGVEVPPSQVLRDLACRLLRVHALRAADALQLAAALVICEQDPASMELVSLDDQLREAAGREGFSVLPV
jgi:predicted nucleic acid-binding protein